MKSKKITLFSVLWRKEIQHWKRVAEIYTKFGNIFSKVILGTIISFLIVLAHYAFVFMSLMSNVLRWMIGLFSTDAKKVYKANLEIMYLSTLKNC